MDHLRLRSPQRGVSRSTRHTAGCQSSARIFIEAIITFILVFVIVSVATDDRVPAAIAPVAVGFALAAAVFIGGPVTGGSVNPARALGPMLVSLDRLELSPIYIIAPIVGGVLAALLYDKFISDAEEPEE
ncbi:MAG: MIP/aquaporin family protein [Rubrobacteraceae bacterium]